MASAFFISAGASDGNPNPIKWAFLAGVGGKGVPGRADDSYGIGVARTQLSSAFLPLLRERLGSGLEHEDALEAYYNLAITGWLSVTPDLQVINLALNKKIEPERVRSRERRSCDHRRDSLSSSFLTEVFTH